MIASRFPLVGIPCCHHAKGIATPRDNHEDHAARARCSNYTAPLLSKRIMSGCAETAWIEQRVFDIIRAKTMLLDVPAVGLIPLKHNSIL